MPNHPGPPRDSGNRSLNRAALVALLERLDADPERAAERYRELHRKLSRLYEWRGCTRSDELADEALDRVALKLEAGLEVHAIESYVARVAWLVFRERVRREQRQRTALEGGDWMPAAEEPDPQAAILRHCFKLCLGQLNDGERQQLLRYYEGERSAKIDNRRRLAEELGLAANALRIRMHRRRQQLEGCVAGCQKRSTAETDRAAASL